MIKILVVDDDQHIAKGIADWLEIKGFEPILAHSGKSAIRCACGFKPSLILLDVMLPFMNGIEICRRLKEDDLTKHIPIIMLTALNAIGDVDKAYKVGANDYLTKPLNLDRLEAKIKKYLNLK